MSAPTNARVDSGSLGFGAELALITAARELDLMTCAYARTPREARAAADAGADLVVAHLGPTRPATADDAASVRANAERRLSAIADESAKRLAPIAAALGDCDALLLCHGGPLDSPTAVHAALRACPAVAGSYGASTLERLPIERAVREATAAYKQANLIGWPSTRRDERGTMAAMPDDVIPFRLNIPEVELADLRARLRSTRWPEPTTAIPLGSMFMNGISFSTRRPSVSPVLGEVLHAIAEGRIDPSPVFSDRLPFDDAAAALAELPRKAVFVR